jgi:polyhydroxybutyrate depolymerase
MSFAITRTIRVVVGVLGVASGCTRATLDVITDVEPKDAGSNDAGSNDAGSNDAATETSDSTCLSATLEAGDSKRTLQVGTATRSYVLHVPAAYNRSRSVPLIVDFHGIGGTGWGQLAGSPYPAVTDPDGVIMAFPDGMTGSIGTAWNMGPCCVAGVDDLGFAKAVVADVKRVACVDAKRVYAIGVLTGGGMAQHLACHAADVFAAIAPAAFDLLAETVDGCKPLRSISVVSFRGTADTHVPYAGGSSPLVPDMPITFLGAEASFDKWAEINRCSGEPSAIDSNGCSSYSNCSDNVEVILCTKQGGREEPGDARVAWPILSRHTLP